MFSSGFPSSHFKREKSLLNGRKIDPINAEELRIIESQFNRESTAKNSLNHNRCFHTWFTVDLDKKYHISTYLEQEDEGIWHDAVNLC